MAMAELAQQAERVAGSASACEAGASDLATMPLSAIAERQQLSIAYLEQIFLKLRRAGLVDSERGRAGGYKLARPAASIMVADIMSAVEEETRMTRCHGEESAGCVGENRCLTHGLWHALGSQIRSFLGRVSLADVISGHVVHDGLRSGLPPQALPTDTAARERPTGLAAR